METKAQLQQAGIDGMAQIQSNLDNPITLNSFFGPLTLQPGLNEVNDRLWRNCKNNNPDVKILLKKGALTELPSADIAAE